jgi:uncharacterized protein YjbI with pentapeptide repeats
MAIEDHFTILSQGVNTWNKWRAENLQTLPLLSGRDLRGLNLTKAEFSFTDLRYAKLDSARLHRADFTVANLKHASLDDAILTDADLIGTDLSYATLRRAVLWGANLSGATVTGADFHDALVATDFGALDLSEAIGLDQLSHDGPSTIGIDTIYKSQGKIPERFLRGCGVPESFILQIRSLVGAVDGIDFYSCFISYSTKDKEFADRLQQEMQQAHLRVWYAPQDIQGGKKLHEQIETAIRIYDKLLLVLSEESLQSEWVMTELRKARKEERASRQRNSSLFGSSTLRH